MVSDGHVGQQFSALQHAKDAWLDDVSMEITSEAARLSRDPHWSSPGRPQPEFQRHARALIAAAEPIPHPVYHGVSARHHYEVGHEEHVPLRATTRNIEVAKGFADPGGYYPDDNTIHEYHRARGTMIHDDEHVITGRYRVVRSDPGHVVWEGL